MPRPSSQPYKYRPELAALHPLPFLVSPARFKTGNLASPPMETQTAKRDIALKKIENRQARSVCFSKRRASLFKKASDLSVLCGAQIAAVVFSPAGNAFTFGSPSADAVIDRFLSAAPPPPDLTREPNAESRELIIQLEQWKKNRQELDETLNKLREHRIYWKAPEELDALNAAELRTLRSCAEKLKIKLLQRANQVGPSQR